MTEANERGRLLRALFGLCNAGKSLAVSVMRQRVFGAAVLASIVAALYWGLIGSDRYVSEALVVIQRTDLTGTSNFNIGSLLGSTGTASAGGDQFLLRDHLRSIDMLKKLDARLDLRGHYSDRARDLLSRMWFRDASLEWFHRHYLSRVDIEFDDYSGVLYIKAQAYDPKMAHAIASMLVQEGERFMNDLGHNLAREQVTFLEKQVVDMQNRVLSTRKTVIDYQNQKGMISPQTTAENVVMIISRLEAQLAELQARRSAMISYLMPDSAGVVELNLQIAAIEKQAKTERARLASPNGKTLNRTVEEFQRLEMNAKFAEDVYKTALVALESGRVEATRTLKKVSILQQPFEPQYPIEPRRFYNTLIFTLLVFVLAGVIQLLLAIVRDHKD